MRLIFNIRLHDTNTPFWLNILYTYQYIHNYIENMSSGLCIAKIRGTKKQDEICGEYSKNKQDQKACEKMLYILLPNWICIKGHVSIAWVSPITNILCTDYNGRKHSLSEKESTNNKEKAASKSTEGMRLKFSISPILHGAYTLHTIIKIIIMISYI